MDGDGHENASGVDSELVRDSSEFFVNLLAEDGTPRFSDLKISCEGELFDVQRAVLAGFSPVLNQLFIKHDKDSPGQPLELGKEFVTRGSFALIWDLIYKGRITIDGDNVLRLHSAANYLQIDQVATKCAAFVVESLHVDSVIPIWQYACTETANAKDLLKPALRFLDENFSKLFKHDNVLTLEVDEFCLLLDQLCKVDDENVVLKSALEWLAHDWKARFCHGEKVMSCVYWQAIDYSRLSGIQALATMESKVDRTSNEELVAMHMILTRMLVTTGKNVQPGPTDPDVYYLVFETEGIWTFRKLSVLQQGLNNVPTVSMTDEKVIHGVGEESRLWCLFNFVGRLFCVVSCQNEEENTQDIMLAAISDNGDYKIIAQLEQMDKSYQLGCLQFSNGMLCSIERRNSIGGWKYAFRVYDLGKFARRLANDNDRFVVAQLCEAANVDDQGVISSTMLPVGNDVYFFGCTDPLDANRNYSVNVNVFRVFDQTWFKLPCLENSRFSCSVSVANGTCFVVGGRNVLGSSSNAVEMMSIDDPSGWTQLPGLKIARWFPAGCSSLIRCGHFLIAFGGCVMDGLPVNKAEILDVLNVANGWKEYSPLHGICPRFVAKM